jgi:type III restriction enzyme
VQVKAVRPERDALEIRFPRVAGYRVELPETRLAANFDDDSVLTLTPDLVGPAVVHVSGIIGEGVDLNLKHLGDTRQSTLLFHLTRHLIETKWRNSDQQPQLNLFGQLKRIAKQWLDTCLVCKGGTYPAQLIYRQLANMACDRISAAITRAHIGERAVVAMLDPYNPEGSTTHVNFTTTRTDRWETDARRCHINWVILDSDWEGEFCRVAEAHPRVIAYVKNRNLGLEVPYRFGSENRTYIPDYIVQVDDGRGKDDPLNLVIEVKGYRREDAKEKAATMRTYWVPGVNNLKDRGRWAFAEFTDVYAMQEDFAMVVEAGFDQIVSTAVANSMKNESVSA